MTEDKLSSRINSVLLSGRADETLAYSKHIKDYDTGKSVKQDLEERVKKTDQLVTDQLADSSVTTPKLADKSITTKKLDDESVATSKLQASSVTTEKLIDHAVTTEKVADKSITNPKLADNSVDGRVIKSKSVDTNHLANESVTTEKVAQKSITNDKMADGTLKIDKLDPELRKTIESATGLPEDLTQMIQDIDETLKNINDTDEKQQVQINDNTNDIESLKGKSDQLEQSIKDISVSGGASTANAVSYNNETSGLDSINAQGAIDELASKKFDKSNVAQELGDSEEMVVSQSALPLRMEESEEWAYLIKDAEDHILLGIQQDGSVEWSKGIPSPVRAKLYEIINQCQQGKEDLSTKLDEINTSLQASLDTKVDKEEGKSLISDEVKDCFKIVENEEFIHCIVDAEEHILFAIRRDTGKPYFPLNEMYHVEQNKEFCALWKDSANHILMGIRRDGVIVGEINACNELKKVIASIQSDVKELQSIDSSLKELLDTFSFQENDEFLEVKKDLEGRILESITSDGMKHINLPTRVPSASINDAAEIIAEENEEWMDLKKDSEDHVIEGISRDGKKYINLPLENPTTKELNDRTSHFSVEDSEEFFALEKDTEGHILSSTNADGSHYIHNVKSETIPEEFSHIEDPEGRMSMETDVDNKILCYRDKDGVKHEHTLQVDVLDFEDCNVGSSASNKIKELAKQEEKVEVKKYALPDYGTVDILQETFYLTANSGYSDKSGIYPIIINEDTQENAQKGLTVLRFFVKSTLTKNQDGTYAKNSNSVALDFYAPSKVTYVDGVPYVTSSLSKNDLDGSYSVQDSSIKVTKIIDVPTIGAWSVDKKTEHLCTVNIDFGHYLKGTFNIGIKYQGSSTLYNRKRNFRFTFYKDSKFSKKDKIKLGEMVRTSGFNLKANYSDRTRLKEFIMNRILMSVWETRGNYHSYPWDRDDTPYSGATGMIKGFPITVNIGGEFYGLDIFGLKKDEKNYLLDGDDSGMIVSGTRGNSADPDNWTGAKPTDWEDEMNDELTESNKTALESFFTFINSEDFTKENVPSRMSVLDWIDYFICLQVFFMPDNTCRNMILYTGSDKQKFYPFFYDLDLSWGFTESNYNMDIMEKSYAADMSLWEHFKNLYWDEIVNRYLFLRENVLSDKKIQAVYDSIPTIPKDIESKEKSKWGTCDVSYMQTLINLMWKRLDWLDNNYFKS